MGATIELEKDALVPLRDCVEFFPRPTPYVTMHGWAKRGVSGVKLRTRRIGQRIFSTKRWVDDFLSECDEL